MSDKRSKKFSGFGGLVFSTDPDQQYNDDDLPEEITPGPGSQDLRISLDKKQRGGKAVTLVTGFKGSLNDLESLGKRIKKQCGVGGTVKDGTILIQGDFVGKIMNILIDDGYKVKRAGG